MKNFLSCVLIILALNFTYSQEAYFSMGRNFTTFDYTNSEGNTNDNIEGSSGAAYELGYVFSLGDKLGLAAGLTLNEFNATGGNPVNNYSWETNYLGVQGIFKYAVLGGRRSDFGLNLNAGINFNHIVSGKQKINGQAFELACEDEFKGLFAQPIIGLDAKYQINSDFALGLGYHFSKNFGLTSSDQKLNFNNSQLQFNLVMSLN